MTSQTTSDVPALVWTYDLGPVTRRVEENGNPLAARLEAEFRKVAALWYLHPDREIAPSVEIDAFWHEFILDSRRYRDFCDKVYGAYQDHVPDDARSGMWGPYEATKEMYRARFGSPDVQLWGSRGANSMRVPPPRG